ncbi:MAG: hypothetical protein V4446_10095 [Pseudomonadota bacterium]
MYLGFRRFKAGSIGIFVLLISLLAALTGCDRTVADSPYKVIDTGYWPAQVNPLAEPLWLDNERIIFTSTESLVPGKPPYSGKVWNMATGKLTSTPLDSVRCAREGQVVYTKKDPSSNQWVYSRGPLESAKEHPAPGADMRMDEFFDCDWVPKESAGQFGFARYPAKSKLRGDNYVEILEPRTRLAEHQKRPYDREQEKKTGDVGSKGKAIYHVSPDDQGREVPIRYWTYSEFLKAYISAGYYDPKDPETRSFWILQRNGGLKEIPYPKAMLEGRNDIYPVKLGYLVQYSDGKYTETDPGDRGLYLMQGKQVQRLIVGAVHSVQISPDGCKAAFVHARNTNEYFSLKNPYRTIKLINFCQGGATP